MQYVSCFEPDFRVPVTPHRPSQAERAHPGLSEDFISGVLDAEGVSLNLPEVLLRLACHDVTTYTISSEEDEFVILNFRAKGIILTANDHNVVLPICTWPPANTVISALKFSFAHN